MQLMYVDESGDPGQSKHASTHYILSGLVIVDQDWQHCLQKMKRFRQELKLITGLQIRTEIHAAELIRINRLSAYRPIRKSVRLRILKTFVQQMPTIFDNSGLLTMCLDKASFPVGTDYQTLAWSRLIQQYDAYLKTIIDRGIIIADDTDDALIRKLLRKMRIYNPVTLHGTTSLNAPTDSILEDVFMRSSQHSLFIQAVDCIAHCLYRREYPEGSLKKFGVKLYFNYLEPLLPVPVISTDFVAIERT